MESMGLESPTFIYTIIFNNIQLEIDFLLERPIPMGIEGLQIKHTSDKKN